MTVGQKIRFYRDLRGFTQAELGSKVGLKADRIRQYETNVRTPKADLLKKIADALDVDVAALSDINITSEEDIMHILFDLEDHLSVNVEKKDGKMVLVFDNEDKRNSIINTYLNYWYDKKRVLSLDKNPAYNDPKLYEYRSWRGRFGSNESSFEDGIRQKILDIYTPEIKKLSKLKTPHSITTSDVVRILCRIPTDWIIDIVYEDLGLSSRTNAVGIIFNAEKLMNPDDVSKDFAQFLYELEYFKTLGCNSYSIIDYTDSVAKITYFIPVSSFGVITSLLDKWLNYSRNKGDYSQLAKEEFESMFEADLKMYTNNIKEEISIYCAR